MLLNLVGPPGAGKTMFAEWFLKRNQNWEYIDIAYIKKTHRVNDEEAWEMAIDDICDFGLHEINMILESTGTILKLAKVYFYIQSHIYTIQLMAPIKICEQRIKKRTTSSTQIEELQMLEWEHQHQGIIEPNLYVNSTNLTEEIMKEMEKNIKKAGSFFITYIGATVVGQNKIKGEKE